MKLLDFGIAKLSTNQVETATGVIKGKLRYMPPEQITGDGVDRRSDIYAVGVMLWEAATGKKMWNDASEANIMNAVLNEEVPTAQSVEPSVPDRMDQIIQKAMAYELDDRYQSAAEMQRDLDSFVSDMGSSIRIRDIGGIVSKMFAEHKESTRAVVKEQLATVIALSDADAENFQPIELTGFGTSTGLSAARATQTTQVASNAKSTFGVALAGGLVAALLIAFWQLKIAKEESQHPAVAAAPVPSEVRVRITSFPATAKLVLDGKALPSNPYSRAFPLSEEKTLELKVTAPGYEPSTRIIPLDQDIDLVVNLREVVTPKAVEPKKEEQPEEKPKPKARKRWVAPKPKAGPKPGANCDPPYTIDARGVKIFKPGCL